MIYLLFFNKYVFDLVLYANGGYFCCVNFEAGEVFGIFILAKFWIVFLRRYFSLKYMLAFQFHVFSFLGLHIYGCVLD